MIKKTIAAIVFAALFIAVAPVSADGGMMQNTPVVTIQPTPQTPVTDSYNTLVSKIVMTTLQLFDWKNDDGEISFTDTNYSVQYNCNTIFGSYTLDRSAVTLSQPASTKMACEEDAMDADQELISDLSKISKLTFKDGKLVMTGNNTTLEFDAGFR
jgi:heat shock protein HslJ